MIESGLLELDPIEMAAKYEFLYRRGILKRPTRKDYQREKKKFTYREVEAGFQIDDFSSAPDWLSPRLDWRVPPRSISLET